MERRSLIPFAPLYPAEAEAALAIFKALRIKDIPGHPTFGECCEQWVFDFVAAIFGAYDSASGKQLIQDFFLLISKKNGKSTIAAGIMLTALIRTWRHSDELLILAPTIEVAGNSFKPAADMVRLDPDLVALMHVKDNFREITHRTTGSTLKVVAADTETVGGKKGGKVLIDELWLFGKKNNAEAMLQEATGGLASRPEGFVINLSTQSDEPPAGVFKERLEYFRDVRDGRIQDPHSLPVIYEYPAAMIENEAYLDPSTFYITNPNLGRSVNREWLERKLLRVQAGDDEAGEDLQTHLSKHANVEIGLRLRRDRWLGADYWQGAADRTLMLESLLARSEVVVAGIDAGGLDDLLGLAVLGREKVTRKWLLWTRAWAHPIVLQRHKQIASLLKGFAADGDLVFCSEPTQDTTEVADLCERIRDAGLFPEKLMIGIDKAGLPAILDELVARGFDAGDTGGHVIGVPQGGFLNPAIASAERKLSDGTLVHGGQPLMTWCVSNAKIEMKGSLRSMVKLLGGKAKIDPLIAAMNAVMLMSKNPVAKTAPNYQMLFVG